MKIQTVWLIWPLVSVYKILYNIIAAGVMDADEQRFDETSVLYLFFFLKKCGELQKPEGHWLLRFVTLLFFAFFLARFLKHGCF